MKKIIVAFLTLALMAALTVTALADADVRVATKDLNVYEEKDTDSRVLRKIKKGDSVLVDVAGSKWCGVLAEDGDGQTIGWVKTKYLKCKHNWTDWKTERKATCTKKGLRTRYCTRCGEEQSKDIDKLDHEFGKWKVKKEATCARKGLRVRTCKVCGYEQEKEYLEEHTYGAWSVVKEASCTEKGERKRTCEVCGHEETKAIDKLPHDFQWKILVEATDHSSGSRARVCQVCGYEEKAQSYDPEGTLRRKDRGDEVRALQQLLVDQGYLNAGGADGIFGGGTEKALMQFQMNQGLEPDGVAWPQTVKRLNHDFGPWETVKALTRTEPGERVRVCKDCGFEQRETIEAGEVIEYGSRGENVRALQQILKQVGYDAGGFDGIYGKKLDSAFEAFNADHGLSFEAGKVRPADVDALVNAWFETGDGELKEGQQDSAVNMALTVTATSDEAEDANATTYTWTLTNLGSKKGMFNALLLTYGAEPDFSKDNLVMVIDGETLKPNAGNSVSGSFSVARDWGDGNLNFAAMAVDEKTGEKWLSNTVVFEAAAKGEPKTVQPLLVLLNVASLPDGTYSVAFDRGDIAAGASGVFMNAVHIFTTDTYDRESVENLAEGDTVVVEGEEMPVQAVESQDDAVIVNGGLDEGGCEFILTEDGSAYRIQQYDDYATYTERGITTLTLDSSAEFIDDWDIDAGTATADYEDIVDAIRRSENDSFDQFNTTVTIQSGKVVEIHRSYVP